MNGGWSGYCSRCQVVSGRTNVTERAAFVNREGSGVVSPPQLSWPRCQSCTLCDQTVPSSCEPLLLRHEAPMLHESEARQKGQCWGQECKQLEVRCSYWEPYCRSNKHQLAWNKAAVTRESSCCGLRSSHLRGRPATWWTMWRGAYLLTAQWPHEWIIE